MRHLSLALLATAPIFGLGGALAADLSYPYRAPPPVVPLSWSWAGFYFGGNVGAGWGTTEASANIGPVLGGGIIGVLPLTSQGLNGFLGGAQAGYNWQFGTFVLGLEGDFEWSGMEGTAPCLVLLSCNIKHQWFGDVTGRLGVVATDKTLVYLKGGVAWTDSKTNITTPGAGGVFSATASADPTVVGGLLGVGAEYAFLPNWSAKLEYNFMDFGKNTTNYTFTTVPAAALPAVPVTTNDFVHVVKAGVNYRF